MRIVILTAGHGGNDQGAVSPDRKWIEGKEALNVRDAVAARLRSAGVPVVTDGNPNENQPLRDALALLRRPNLVAVEIHFNAGPVKATGVEALSLPGLRATAQRVAKATADALELPLRGDQGWKPDTAGQHHRLAFCRSGGVILEVAFISNSSDMNAYQRQFVALADGLATTLAELSAA